MSSRLIDARRRRLRVTRVVVLRKRSKSRKTTCHSLLQRPPDTLPPTQQDFQRPSSLSNFLQHHKPDACPRDSKERERLRITRVDISGKKIPGRAVPGTSRRPLRTDERHSLCPRLPDTSGPLLHQLTPIAGVVCPPDTEVPGHSLQRYSSPGRKRHFLPVFQNVVLTLLCFSLFPVLFLLVEQKKGEQEHYQNMRAAEIRKRAALREIKQKVYREYFQERDLRKSKGPK